MAIKTSLDKYQHYFKSFLVLKIKCGDGTPDVKVTIILSEHFLVFKLCKWPHLLLTICSILAMDECIHTC